MGPILFSVRSRAPQILFLKSKIAGQAGYYLLNGRWHKLAEGVQAPAEAHHVATSHYHVLAVKKLKGSSSFQDLSPAEQIDEVKGFAAKMQSAASASAAVSMWKKAAMSGKNPTPAQWKAFHALPHEQKEKLLEAATGANAGSTDHLKDPGGPAAEAPTPAAPDPKTIALASVNWAALSLPDTNTNAPSVNKKVAALKAATEAGDAAAVAAIKTGTNTYNLKIEAAKQKVLAALGGAPAPAAPPKVVSATVKKPAAPELMHSFFNAEDGVAGIVHKHTDGKWSVQLKDTDADAVLPQIHFYPTEEQAIASAKAAAGLTSRTPKVASVSVKQPAQTVQVPAALLHNTQDGHNKFWSVSVHGNVMKTVYGKIGTKGQTTEKTFPSEAAAKAAAAKLVVEKKAKGYEYGGEMNHAHEVGAQADTGPKDGDTKEGADGTLVFKDGRWHKVGDVAAAAAAPAPETPAVLAAAPGTPLNIDGWKKVGGKKGSNPGGVFEAPDGAQYYVKFPADPDHAKNEVLAAKLYELAGVTGPISRMAERDGKVGIASLMDPTLKHDAAALSAGKVHSVKSGFAADAWLANYDVAGLGFDNVMVKPNGQAVRIDVGAGMEYRAQGKKKEFGPKVTENKTLLDPAVNAQSAAMFAGITPADITAGVAKIAAIDDDTLRATVMAYGPGDAANRQNLADTLIARKADLLEQYPAAKKHTAKAAHMPWVHLRPGESIVESGSKFGVDWAKIKVPASGWDASKIPAPPDFFTNGSQGPTHTWKSSKEHVNQANNADAKKIYDAATTEATASKVADLKFSQIDKESGNPTGTMLPFEQHPAAEIKEYFTQVKSELSAQTRATYKTVQNGSFTQGYSTAAARLAKDFKPVDYAKFSAHTAKAADYLVLHKSAAAVLPSPDTGMFNEVDEVKSPLLAAFKTQSAQKFATLTEAEKKACKSYTGNAFVNWNEALRTGKTESSHFKSAQPMVTAFKKAATDLPEGTVLWRGLGVGEDTYKSVTGSVIQDGSFQSCSFGDKPAFSGYKTWLKIHVGKGVKALHATNFSHFGSGEREIILQNNVRYAVLAVHHHKNFVTSSGTSMGERTVVELLALPHEG